MPTDFNPNLATLTVGNGALADFLRLTPQHISLLAKQGVLPKESRGAYPFQACVLAYIEHKSREETLAQGLDEEEQRVRIEERKLKVAKMQGEVGDLRAMERDNFARGRAIRDLIGQVAARIAPVGAKRLGCDMATLRAWLDESMHALALETLEAARAARDALLEADEANDEG